MIDNNTKISEFEKWLQKSGFRFDVRRTEKSIIESANNLGIQLKSIFDESDPTKIQLLASEMIVKRDKTGIDSIVDYENMISLLVCFIDYLKRPVLVQNAVSTKKRDKTKDSLTVSYFLSRFNMNAVESLGYHTFREAFDSISRILDQKPSTIKNMRDEYDPYFDNGRVGWYQREMSPSRREIYDLYKANSEADVELVVKEILSYYQNASKDTNEKHRHKITIKKSDMFHSLIIYYVIRIIFFNLFININSCYFRLGKYETCNEMLEKVDDENKTIVYKLVGVDIMKPYKNWTTTLNVMPVGEGSLVKWTFEFEKQNENIPDPLQYVEFMSIWSKNVDAYLLTHD